MKIITNEHVILSEEYLKYSNKTIFIPQRCTYDNCVVEIVSYKKKPYEILYRITTQYKLTFSNCIFIANANNTTIEIDYNNYIEYEEEEETKLKNKILEYIDAIKNVDV